MRWCVLRRQNRTREIMARKLGSVEGLLMVCPERKFKVNPRRAGTVGAQRRGAHNPTWVDGEGFLEVVKFQLSPEGENHISVT